MPFQRAFWHSGLTYQHICFMCDTVVQYTDYQLDFRPWFPDGFVYCPRCNTPLRHSEQLAINPPVVTPPPSVETPPSSEKASLPPFCSQCGKQFRDGDAFCSGCGTKRG